MTVYGYARVSTDEQSSDLQADALARAGATTVFADDGVGGKVPAAQRPAFSELLRAVQRGDTVVFYALSRLGRSMRDVVNTLAELEERGVFIRSVTESLDTATPTGRAMVGMIIVFAQLEREMIVERTRAGMSAAKARGVRLGRPRADRSRAAEMLASGASVEATVAATGLSVSTVRRVARGA